MKKPRPKPSDDFYLGVGVGRALVEADVSREAVRRAIEVGLRREVRRLEWEIERARGQVREVGR